MDSQSEPHGRDKGACRTGSKAQSLRQQAGCHQSKTVGTCLSVQLALTPGLRGDHSLSCPLGTWGRGHDCQRRCAGHPPPDAGAPWQRREAVLFSS